MDQLRVQIVEVFKSAVSLFSLTACIDKNYGWFALSLLFEREVFLQSDSNGSRDDSGSDEGSGGGKSEVESGIKEGCVYGKDKKLS